MPIRLGLGILLIADGLLGFLPVVGFWMIPTACSCSGWTFQPSAARVANSRSGGHRRKEKGDIDTDEVNPSHS